jgi:hypothetical protein
VSLNLEEKRFNKKIRVIFNKMFKTQSSIAEKTDHLTVFHPVAPTDRFELKIRFSLPKDTKVKNIRYALFSEQEFSECSRGLKKLKNDVYDNLRTERKRWDTDELYDLTQDLAMNRNLLKSGENGAAADYKESLRRWFEFYFQKGRKLVGNLKARKLTPKQIEMLKSLGYL